MQPIRANRELTRAIMVKDQSLTAALIQPARNCENMNAASRGAANPFGWMFPTLRPSGHPRIAIAETPNEHKMMEAPVMHFSRASGAMVQSVESRRAVTSSAHV